MMTKPFVAGLSGVLVCGTLVANPVEEYRRGSFGEDASR